MALCFIDKSPYYPDRYRTAAESSTFVEVSQFGSQLLAANEGLLPKVRKDLVIRINNRVIHVAWAMRDIDESSIAEIRSCGLYRRYYTMK